MNIFKTIIVTTLFSLPAQWANAQVPLVLDSFDLPKDSRSAATTAERPAAAARVTIQDTVTVPGGLRDTRLEAYTNPLGSIAAVAVGNGKLSVAQGVGAMAETIIAYGAFTRPSPSVGGPHLGLDLSAYKELKFTFAGVEDNLNVGVTYYTSAPLDPSSPQYYASSGVNVAPTASGDPLSFVLPLPKAPNFNWGQVDGVVVIINRSGPTPHTAYTLDQLTFVGP